MRTLLSTTIRPRLGQLSTNTGRSIPSATRRTVGAPTRRKLSFNDAFTLLLAPILGTALIADTTWKDKKQRDWNTRIAEVLEDLAAIQEKELQAWHNVQVCSIHSGVVQQRRSYSSHVSNRQITNCLQEVDTSNKEMDSRRLIRLCYGQRRGDQQNNTETVQQMTISDIYENLIATRLAIEMLLFMRSKSVDYENAQDVLRAQAFGLPKSADELFKQLHDTDNQIQRLRGKIAPRTWTEDTEIDKARRDLNHHVGNICKSYRMGRIDTGSLVQAYAESIMRSQRHLSLPVYGHLLEAISTRNQGTELSGIVIKAMRSSRQLLGPKALWAIIWQYGKAKNSGKLEHFLATLTRSHSRTTLDQPWEHVSVGRTRVAAPIDRNSSLLNVLVKVALQCDMVEKAEAWAVLLCERGVQPTKFSYIIRNLLSRCSEARDWYLGRQWLQRAIMWASYLEQEGSEALSRTIYRMLDLCVTCEQKEAYDEILDAAISSGIQAHAVDGDRPLSVRLRGRSIRSDWSRRLKCSPHTSKVQNHSSGWRARHFQKCLAKGFPVLAPFIGVKEQDKLRRLTAQFDGLHDTEFDPNVPLSPQRIMSFGRENATERSIGDSLAVLENDEHGLDRNSRWTTETESEIQTSGATNPLSRLHLLTDHHSMLQELTKAQEVANTLAKEVQQHQRQQQQDQLSRTQMHSSAKSTTMKDARKADNDSSSNTPSLITYSPLSSQESRKETQDPQVAVRRIYSIMQQERPSIKQDRDVDSIHHGSDVSLATKKSRGSLHKDTRPPDDDERLYDQAWM